MRAFLRPWTTGWRRSPITSCSVTTWLCRRTDQQDQGAQAPLLWHLQPGPSLPASVSGSGRLSHVCAQRGLIPLYMESSTGSIREPPYYLATYLNSVPGHKETLRQSVGFTRPALDYEALREVYIPIPRGDIQLAIGHKVRAAERLREEAELSRKVLHEWLNSSLPEWETPAEQVTVSPSSFQALSPERLDAWFNHPRFQQLEHLLAGWKNLISLAEVAN